ncbi:DNA-directed RNA polymerase I subunit RPA12 [Fopius arisanus]|uniref:DNA-directed RNA polymerase subunit n=1 Tax=Fopius arisanus TaxID=64838 RepID=A0A9R1TX65_9HYME|nr:PREDICTED: DNA-directed RNA polymerase I subunit RPA12 [Fopius arisanus]
MALDGERVCFNSPAGFCSDCGSILPLLGDRGAVKCYACGRSWGPEVFGDMAMTYTITMTALDAYEDTKVKEEEEKEEEAEGPVVDRKCPQCGNDKMSYATLQLRSADEGQTVFYTCTKCKFKETENS